MDKKKHFGLVLTILCLIVIGFIFSADYGISWDEPDNITYGQQALQAYITLDLPVEWHSNLESKGPFFMVITEVFSNLLTRIFTRVSVIEAHHFSYFLGFTMATAAFYAIATRLAERLAALSATLLFATQPLLFGHAFINPKDIPFMAFFLLTMSLGVSSIERLREKTNIHLPELGLIAVTGIMLGLTTSIRIFGAFAGFLITLLSSIRLGKNAVPYLAGLWLIAAFSMYASWPYLWGNPVDHLNESLKVMLDFPWDNLVLYRGLLYPTDELPWHFLPFITVIQLTEALLVLAVIGGVWGLVRFVSQPRLKQSILYLLIILWIAIPYGYSIASGATVYDNSRQFLFALPPIALVTAPVFGWLYKRFKQNWVQVTIVLAAISPGLLGIVRLHPYEYIYYNSIVGGVEGAYRTYELDYWATSYREAMQRINAIAPIGTVVEVHGPWQAAAQFSRSDFTVNKSGDDTSSIFGSPRYIIISTRINADQRLFTDATIVANIEVAGATLSVIKFIE